MAATLVGRRANNAASQGRCLVPWILGLVGQRLSERLGQQFVVEDRPGAGGSIATQIVVNSPADGYTLLLATSANAVSDALP